jgi:hypothetical protein
MMDSDSDSEDSIVIINEYNDNSESETDIETDSDSDNEIEEFEVEPNDWEYDEIYQEDSLHVYSEKENNAYYVGLAKYMVKQNVLLMINSVSANTFFRYSFQRIRDYLGKYSLINVQNAKIHIMKLCILPDDTYSVVLKTHWLRLIQRHWKKVYKERARVIRGRRSIKNMLLKEIHGRYPGDLNRIPGIHGMLECYKTS